MLDAAGQIRLFGKLKLAKCAQAERCHGHFYVSAEERFFFRCYLQLNKHRALRSARIGRVADLQAANAQALRELHSYRAVTDSDLCFRPVLTDGQKLGAMHSRRVIARCDRVGGGRGGGRFWQNNLEFHNENSTRPFPYRSQTNKCL